MKRIEGALIRVLVLLAAAVQWQCFDDTQSVDRRRIVGSGVVVPEIRTIPQYSGIRLVNLGRLYLTAEQIDGIRIESDDNIIDLVEVWVSDDVLNVGLQDGSYSDITLRFYVPVTPVQLLEIIGAAEIESLADLQTDQLACRIIGTGKISVTGTTSLERVDIVGSGTVENFGLRSSHCAATISGTGDIDVFVTDELEAVISGVGTIRYGGNPGIVRQTVTGVGSVQPQ